MRRKLSFALAKMLSNMQSRRLELFLRNMAIMAPIFLVFMLSWILHLLINKSCLRPWIECRGRVSSKAGPRNNYKAPVATVFDVKFVTSATWILCLDLLQSFTVFILRGIRGLWRSGHSTTRNYSLLFVQVVATRRMANCDKTFRPPQQLIELVISVTRNL